MPVERGRFGLEKESLPLLIPTLKLRENPADVGIPEFCGKNL